MSDSEAKLGMAELVFIFKTGQEDVDPFNDPAEETRESLDRSKYALFKDFTGDNGREAKRILGESAAYASAVMRTQIQDILLHRSVFRGQISDYKVGSCGGDRHPSCGLQEEAQGAF